VIPRRGRLLSREPKDAKYDRGDKPLVTADDIKRGLRKLGLSAGCVVFVHSSLSAFGYVDGGAEAVIDAIFASVGAEGTVGFPTYSNNAQVVTPTPEEAAQGVTFKKRVHPFDPEKDGCWTGRIPDTFWRRKGTLRSTHPTHSIAAVGPDAGRICEKKWDALWDLDAFILLLGVGVGCCSSMHLAERRFVDLPQRIIRRITPPADLAERFERENVHFGFGPYPDIGRMEKPLRDEGILAAVTIGAAQVKLGRLRLMVDSYCNALRADPDSFYGGE